MSSLRDMKKSEDYLFWKQTVTFLNLCTETIWFTINRWYN